MPLNVLISLFHYTIELINTWISPVSVTSYPRAYKSESFDFMIEGHLEVECGGTTKGKGFIRLFNLAAIILSGLLNILSTPNFMTSSRGLP